MSDLRTMSEELVERLDLAYEPVGVSLYLKDAAVRGSPTPSATAFKSYCHAIVAAGQGEELVLTREQMGCKLGTSVLGFEADTDAYLDDGVLEKFGVGLFATEEASAATIMNATYLDKGQTRVARIAPLSVFEETPQVVVFTANSEQVMWLLYAANYDTGGPMSLPQSGGALGGCADITAMPILEGVANITFLGLGCRIKSAIDACHLMMGAPGSQMATIHEHIMSMERPINMLNAAKGAG